MVCVCAQEWEWPHSADGVLRVGAVGTSATRRVRLWLRNPAPAPLCVRTLRAALPGAHLALHACAAVRHQEPDHACVRTLRSRAPCPLPGAHLALHACAALGSRSPTHLYCF